MENATKSLFIAAAIIITLSIITIMVNVFLRNSVGIQDGTIKIEMSTIAYHNSQFTIYERDNLVFEQLQSLIGRIIENNNRQTDEKFMVSVELEQYGKKAGSVLYESKGTFRLIQYPINNDFIYEDWCPYLDSDSVYKGEFFNVSANYNDAGIIDLIRIDNVTN